MDYCKLKGKLVEKRLTYKECASVIGISVTSFSKKINGSSKFNIDEVICLSNILSLTPEEEINIFLR